LHHLSVDELHQRFRMGGRDGDAARDELLLRYEPFIRAMAGRFAYRGETLEDLVQVAWCAALRAVDAFDPELGHPFKGYLAVCVSGELKRHFRDKLWSVRVPRGLLERYLEARATSERLRAELGRAPTIAELADRVGATQEDLLEAMEVGHAYRAASLDVPRRPDDTGAYEVPTDEPGYRKVDTRLTSRAVLAPLLEALSDDDAALVRDYFLARRKQTDLAVERGVSQVTISRRLARAIGDLRRHAATSGIER
jgi:RNA polymerase sigma-B factor